MGAISWVLGGAAFGTAARVWQLAILRRGIFENLWGHTASAAGWGSVAFLAYNGNEWVEEQLGLWKRYIELQKKVQQKDSSEDSS